MSVFDLKELTVFMTRAPLTYCAEICFIGQCLTRHVWGVAIHKREFTVHASSDMITAVPPDHLHYSSALHVIGLSWQLWQTIKQRRIQYNRAEQSRATIIGCLFTCMHCWSHQTMKSVVSLNQFQKLNDSCITCKVVWLWSRNVFFVCTLLSVVRDYMKIWPLYDRWDHWPWY